MPLVSIIIPTHKGAEEQTARCVESVKNSTYTDLEIIVVNEGLERSAQRNIGIDRAKGRYLLFLDSDHVVSPYLIQACAYIAEQHNTSLYIVEIIMTKGFFGRLRNWERVFYTGTCVDCVRFVKAEGCPRFDLSMSGPEDADWNNRITGHKTVCKEVLWHYDDIGLIRYLKKKVYYAKSMEKYRQKWPDDKVLNFWYRCFSIFLEDGKWRRLLQRPHYTMCLLGIVFLRGIIYLCRKKF